MTYFESVFEASKVVATMMLFITCLLGWTFVFLSSLDKGPKSTFIFLGFHILIFIFFPWNLI